MAFIEDNTDKVELLPVLQKADQPWQWILVKIILHALEFEGHYVQTARDW